MLSSRGEVLFGEGRCCLANSVSCFQVERGPSQGAIGDEVFPKFVGNFARMIVVVP